MTKLFSVAALASSALLAALLASPLNVASAADVQTVVKGWANNQSAFNEMSVEIGELADLNLLDFPGAKMVVADQVDSPQFLIDGEAGTLGGSGRVMTNGAPSRVVFYLGQPRSISAIRVFTGNIDARGNQDFEIRLANNAANPGQQPKFPEAPNFTSGDKVVGGNGGGYMTSYEGANGGLIDEQTYDWIEFKLWRTYNVKAGEPGKAQSAANSWGSVVELQVLGNPNDPKLFASEEERADWLAKRAARKVEAELNKLGPDVAFAVQNLDSLRLAIDDMIANYPDEFEEAGYMERWEEFRDRFAAEKTDAAKIVEIAKEYDAFRREVLLAHPVFEFDNILLRKTTNPALMPNWISNASRHRGKYDDSLVTLSVADMKAPLKEITKGRKESFIGDIALHWDADRCLVTALSDAGVWQIFECNLEDGSLRQVTPEMGGDVNNVEGCYVPDGSTLFVSTASMMGVPCIGGSDVVGNIYRLEADGETVRQLTFEQDQDWCPTILPNGRILYLRWEYVDITHYYSRYLFTMNPDGTNQVEHYGSGGYWPNSLFYAKPLPEQSSKFVGIVTGHHGVAREGELVIFDPAKGRKETTGVVQRIPGRDNPPANVTIDQLVDNSWPKFLFPYPLDDQRFLVSCRMKPSDPWGLYLVDTFDNMVCLRQEEGYHLLEPTALIPRDEPTTIPDRTVPGAKDSNVFITDVYFGQGLPNVPKGTVKKLRVFAVSYGYRGVGGHDVFGVESCWDGRRLLGEVPVYEDGSAAFKIPANTPVVLQPLDAEGAAVQTMRSWFVGMPGENQSCIGCHETQNDVSPTQTTIARTKQPVDLTEFYGPERPFSFEGEVQPVLDKFCVGCHDGSEAGMPNFADTNRGPRNFSNAYHALHGYVRRPGPESDAYVFKPMEYHSSTSELVQMLKKGHHGVELDEEAWRRLHCWIDLNVPYFGSWTEIVEAGKERGTGAHVKNISDRYVELKKLYAGNDLNFETDAYYYDEAKKSRPAFVAPKEQPELDRSAPQVANWPFDAAKAKAMQNAATAANDAAKAGGDYAVSVVSSQKATVALEEGLTFEMARIPAGSFAMGDENGFADEFPRSAVTIEKPFWMATTETTNAMYKLFDATHDSRYIDQQNKDHVLPGYPANLPNQPVIRVSQAQATAFCAWLSEKTGKKFRLPTEAEWEWAARAGSATSAWYGDGDADFGKFENLSDVTTKRFVVQGVNPQPVGNPADWLAFIPRVDAVNDGQMIATDVGSYAPNPWGLYDMLGNVSEWTSSDYKPYPYNAADGRESGSAEAKKVARGGSWSDRPKWGRSGVRRDYESWQPVHNVGFRVVCEDDLAK